jgi:hypothetical protein
MDLPNPSDSFGDHGMGELMSNWTIVEPDGTTEIVGGESHD